MPDYLEKFEKMRVAGNLAARTLDMLTDNIKPGVTTEFIDKLGYEFIRDNGAYSAPLFYRGFKKSLCTSLNHVVCHGIPSDRILVEGDALNVDVTAIVDEHYGDTSRMFCIGKTPIKLFDTERDNPFLIEAGNYIKFDSITLAEFDQISDLIKIGNYAIRKESKLG